jgi:hypothetical protein
MVAHSSYNSHSGFLALPASSGVGVHVSEWGAYSYTPHAVTLAWISDCLENWRQAGFGWALWNLRGSFGVLDSGRKDVIYEDYQGHPLDRKMLDLLLQGLKKTARPKVERFFGGYTISKTNGCRLSLFWKEGIDFRPAVGANTFRHPAAICTDDDFRILDRHFLLIFDTISHVFHRISSSLKI